MGRPRTLTNSPRPADACIIVSWVLAGLHIVGGPLLHPPVIAVAVIVGEWQSQLGSGLGLSRKEREQGNGK